MNALPVAMQIGRRSKTVLLGEHGDMMENTFWQTLENISSFIEWSIKKINGERILKDCMEKGDSKEIIYALLEGQTLDSPDWLFAWRFPECSELVHRAVWHLAVPKENQQEYIDAANDWIAHIKDGSIPKARRHWWGIPVKMWKKRVQKADAMLKTPQILPKLQDDSFETIINSALLLDIKALRTMADMLFTDDEKLSLICLFKRLNIQVEKEALDNILDAIL